MSEFLCLEFAEADAGNPRYLGGCDQEDYRYRPVVCKIPIAKTTRQKWTVGVT
jgi:hypothetical protein